MIASSVYGTALIKVLISFSPGFSPVPKFVMILEPF